MRSGTLIATCVLAGVAIGAGYPAPVAIAQELTPANAAQATALARNGQYDAALAMLAELRATAPTDTHLLHDEIVVLGWAERDAAVMERAAAVDAASAPRFVLTAIAKAARNLKRFDDAALWYRRALAQTPGDLDAATGLALTEIDRGDAAAARAALAALPADAAATPRATAAHAYVAQSAGAPLEALRHYERLLEQDGSDRGAARGKALALRALLLPSEALAFAAQHEGVLTDAEIARLRVDETALSLRLVTSTPYPPGEREPNYARALATLDTKLAATSDPAALVAVRSDRVVALAQANRSRDALAEFATLRALTPSPPFEALVAAGRANLDLGNAQAALELLSTARAQKPADLDVQFDLVFAYLAAEETGAALSLAHELARSLPPLTTGPDALVTKGNPVALRAEIVAALTEAYTDQLRSAQRRLEAVLDAAPGNTEARQELANVYRWRGWLGRSQAEYRQVLAVQPDALTARAGYAHARLDAAAFPEVERIVDELILLDARDRTVRRLNERWEIEQRSELRLDASDSRSSGSTFGTDSGNATATWLSQPLRQWRAVAQSEYAYAEFPEGEGVLRRLGAGAEYRSEHWHASAVALRRTDADHNLGYRLSGERRLGDYWRIDAFYDVDSPDTPLRGRRVGLTSDVVGALVELRPNESGGVSFGWRHREHSDGNDGNSYYAQGWFRLRNDPRSKLDVTGDLATANNDFELAPYFSPRHDLFALGGIRHSWRFHRRDDRSLVQVVDLAGGRYDQAGFASGRIWRVGYRLRLDWNQALRAELGAERARLFYDGAPEHATSLSIQLTARL